MISFLDLYKKKTFVGLYFVYHIPSVPQSFAKIYTINLVLSVIKSETVSAPDTTLIPWDGNTTLLLHSGINTRLFWNKYLYPSFVLNRT